LSVPTKSSRWVDCLKIGQVELAKGPQGVGSGAVLQVVRQGFEPAGILRLQFRQFGNSVVPAPGAAAMIGWAARAYDRGSGRARGAMTGLAFGIRHRPVADRFARHGSTPKRDVTKPKAHSVR